MTAYYHSQPGPKAPKKIKSLTCIILLIAVFGSGCKHEIIYPEQEQPVTDPTGGGNGGGGGGASGIPCDPDTIYFENSILPMLVSNCAMSGCHDAATASDGVILTSYASVMATADVRPFDLQGSDLYEVITETDPDKKMPPPPRPSLSAAQISMIATWINQGAQNLTCGINCDTLNIKFSTTINPILQNKCVGCHSGSNPPQGINLSAYSGVLPVALNGKLYGAVSHTAGFVAMPQSGPKIPDCEILQIKKWIDAGSPNN
jgi:hypothetical protein